MPWRYDEMEKCVRTAAERDGNLEILRMTSEELRELFKELYLDHIVIQEKRSHEEKVRRCERLCESVRILLDSLYAAERPYRAAAVVLSVCDVCQVTCAVEFDIPLYFYVELLEIDGIKIAIDSLLRAVVGEIDAEVVVEYQLNAAFLNELSEDLFRRAEYLRQSGKAKIVDRYKDKEYTVDLLSSSV